MLSGAAFNASCASSLSVSQSDGILAAMPSALHKSAEGKDEIGSAVEGVHSCGPLLDCLFSPFAEEVRISESTQSFISSSSSSSSSSSTMLFPSVSSDPVSVCIGNGLHRNNTNGSSRDSWSTRSSSTWDCSQKTNSGASSNSPHKCRIQNAERLPTGTKGMPFYKEDDKEIKRLLPHPSSPLTAPVTSSITTAGYRPEAADIAGQDDLSDFSAASSFSLSKPFSNSKPFNTTTSLLPSLSPPPFSPLMRITTCAARAEARGMSVHHPAQQTLSNFPTLFPFPSWLIRSLHNLGGVVSVQDLLLSLVSPNKKSEVFPEEQNEICQVCGQQNPLRRRFMLADRRAAWTSASAQGGDRNAQKQVLAFLSQLEEGSLLGEDSDTDEEDESPFFGFNSSCSSFSEGDSDEIKEEGKRMVKEVFTATDALEKRKLPSVNTTATKGKAERVSSSSSTGSLSRGSGEEDGIPFYFSIHLPHAVQDDETTKTNSSAKVALNEVLLLPILSHGGGAFQRAQHRIKTLSFSGHTVQQKEVVYPVLPLSPSTGIYACNAIAASPICSSDLPCLRHASTRTSLATPHRPFPARHGALKIKYVAYKLAGIVMYTEGIGGGAGLQTSFPQYYTLIKKNYSSFFPEGSSNLQNDKFKEEQKDGQNEVEMAENVAQVQFALKHPYARSYFGQFLRKNDDEDLPFNSFSSAHHITDGSSRAPFSVFASSTAAQGWHCYSNDSCFPYPVAAAWMENVLLGKGVDDVSMHLHPLHSRSVDQEMKESLARFPGMVGSSGSDEGLTESGISNCDPTLSKKSNENQNVQEKKEERLLSGFRKLDASDLWDCESGEKSKRPCLPFISSDVPSLLLYQRLL